MVEGAMPKNITRTTVESTDDSGKKITNETEIEQPSLWDRATPIATIAGIIVALITAWGTIFGYFRQIDQDRFTRNIQLKTEARNSTKVFNDKQSELYFKIVNLVGDIAAKKSPTDKDLDDFNSMYWGSLAMVEDKNVSQAMIIVGLILRNKPIDQDCLKGASLVLAHCVKRSLENTYSVILGEPPEMPCAPSSFQNLQSCFPKKVPTD
jgi:hypothetical protein